MVLGYHSGKILNARTRESRCRAGNPARQAQPARAVLRAGSGGNRDHPAGATGGPEEIFFPLRGFVTKTQNNTHKQISTKGTRSPMFSTCYLLTAFRPGTLQKNH
jgi:hypothetical protein